jgi:uncharacterized protein YdhG (YjbR/CyaY superfamily)
MPESGSQIIEDYLASAPEAARPLLRELRARIGAMIPGATERITYGLPTFFWGENVVHYAVYEHHIGFYPTPSVISAFQGEFGKRKWAKGSVQFPLDEPTPWDLIERMVKFRVAEVTARAASAPKAVRKGS